jgi:hypothetical protein
VSEHSTPAQQADRVASGTTQQDFGQKFGLTQQASRLDPTLAVRLLLGAQALGGVKLKLLVRCPLLGGVAA